MTRFFLFLIRSYQYLLSPLFPPSCRFTPSCSHYFSEALIKHGWFHGTRIGIWRLLRCNPWCAGGYDPVP